MMIYLGIVLVIATIYFLVKRYDARLVLLASGIIMACVAGTPMASLSAFAKNMTNGGLIQAVCSVMGFAMVMKYTECDKHLINFMASGLSKFRLFLIPGVVFATYAVNIALPSAAGTAAAAGAIFVPLMMSAGVHPAMAGAAVKCGTYGSMLNPGLAHNPFVAKIAGISVMEVIGFHYKANIASLVMAAILITVIAYYKKEHQGYKATDYETDESFKVNFLYALMPILPIIVLILGSTKVVPALKMGVPEAMLNNPAIVKVCAAIGPFILGVVTGSGDAATFAFNEAVTPHAKDFGMSAVQMGSMATLGGTLGRTMSPIAGATIIIAGIAGVNPMEIAKRNYLPMIGAMIAGMIFLLM